MIAEKTFGFLLVLALSIQQIVGPPAVIKNKPEVEKEKAIEENEVNDMMETSDFKTEYQRYLEEVVKTLETDEEFKKVLEKSVVDDVHSGKIARELEKVNHNVRSKLDEVKRQEVQRLKELVKKKEELGHGPLHPSEYEHIDHLNLDTFEVRDLDNLIKKVAKDMEKMNELRREEFKKYEMEKQFEDEMKMKNMTDTEKEEYKHHLEEMKKKHANHERIHHPGSKAQLEEVWEKQDHLENQEFDPKIFFHLHDIDSNGYWDTEEVKALFIKELDKMYQAGLPEDDMKERQEEMERMTEHVFKEMDKNGDNLISFQEYMAETKTKEFNQDDGWETLDKQQIYSQREYEEFERRRLAEIQQMIDQGLIPPESYPGMYHPNQIPVHPNQVPQYHPNQVPPYHPNQVPQQAYHPNQMPQHPNQVPQHPNQVPQHPNQLPQHPNQIPQHPNQYQNQIPQHPSQQQYQPQQGYQQNQQQHNQVPQQQYQQNPPYPPASQHGNNNQPPQYHQNNQQQYQNNQQYHQDPNSQPQNNQQQDQYKPNQNNHQQDQYKPNQNNQQYQHQPDQNSHQQNQQQPKQNNQQYQQPNQNNQQYQQPSQNNQQYQQPNQNNQQYQQPNQNKQNQAG